ncbi:MAG: hypothetical protein RR406_05540, partial [Bacilli bacterium]
WVWIPKYEYKVEAPFGKGGTSAALPGEIEVNFKNRTDTTPSAGYTLHPSFNFGGENISGLWFGKFELTGTINAPTIKPNSNPLANQVLSAFFNASRAMQNGGNQYGFSTASGDVHMMKNIDWGAVTYLSQSKYGKYGNPNYAGANKEVYINNYWANDKGFTGCSAGNTSSSAINTCTYTYEKDLTGTGASTTGTIYGIYDMSGGLWEYAMGVYNRISASSGFTTFPDPKYYDLYTDQTGIKGDATNADGTIGWYSDLSSGFINSNIPWFFKGGYYNRGSTSGLFVIANDPGIMHSSRTSRYVAKP